MVLYGAVCTAQRAAVLTQHAERPRFISHRCSQLAAVRSSQYMSRKKNPESKKTSPLVWAGSGVVYPLSIDYLLAQREAGSRSTAREHTGA